jgi:FAD/FMN-containing dehydrogenase
MASAVIQPASAEEVAAIVKAANEHKMPVSPISIGRNLGYGGTAPRLRGTTVIDMRRMDKILEVNEDSAYCLVEPGVSYFNMYEHLRKIGSNLWIDTPDIGWGSMIGNMTERGAGYTPYGDHFMM